MKIYRLNLPHAYLVDETLELQDVCKLAVSCRHALDESERRRCADSDNASLIIRHSIAKGEMKPRTITTRQMWCLVFLTFLAWSSAGNGMLGTHCAHAQLAVVPVPRLHQGLASRHHRAPTSLSLWSTRFLIACLQRVSRAVIAAPALPAHVRRSLSRATRVVTTLTSVYCRIIHRFLPFTRPRDPRQDHIPSVS